MREGRKDAQASPDEGADEGQLASAEATDD